MHRRKRDLIHFISSLFPTFNRRRVVTCNGTVLAVILSILLILPILYPNLIAEMQSDVGSVDEEGLVISNDAEDIGNLENESGEPNENFSSTIDVYDNQTDNYTDDTLKNLSCENLTLESPNLSEENLSRINNQNVSNDTVQSDEDDLQIPHNLSGNPSDAVDLEYLQPEHKDIIIGEPARWKEKIIARNILNETVKGNLSLDLPEGIFDIKIRIENETYYNTSTIWIELGPKEEKEIDVEFLASPVEMEIEYVNVTLSSLLPSEAKNIRVYENGTIKWCYNSTKNLSNIIIARGKKIRLYHSSPLPYHNVTLEIPIESNKVSVEGDGSYLLKDGALKWNIGELSSSANITIMPDIKISQGNVTFGKPVEWKMRCGNFTIRYSTPAPIKREFLEKNNERIYRKRIFVSSNSSLAYKNVKVCTRIPEVRYELQVSFDDLDHTGISYNLLDRDGNNLFDTIEWIIPELSHQNYVVSIDFNRVRFADRFADHINNYDGTYTAYIYSGPINYYDENKGCFLPINTTIENISYNGFEYANLKNNFAVYFDKDKARVMLRYKDCSVIWSIGDQDFGKIQNFSVFVNGSTITYENIFDGIDLRYKVTYDGLCEEIILKKPLDIKSLTEEIELSGDCYCEEDNGTIYLCSKGSRIFEIKKPFMKEENDPAERCYDLRYEIKRNGSTYYITKVIENLSWLKDASREYPIVLDPSVTIVEVDPGSGENDGYVYGSDTSYAKARITATGYTNIATTLWIGQRKNSLTGNYEVFRSFLKFDTSSIPSSATITSAALKLYGYGDYSSTDFHIRLTRWTGDTPIDAGDYLQFDGTLYDDGSFSTSSFTTSGYNTITISNYSLITKAGYTKICVASDRDINGVQPTGNEYVIVYSYEQGSGYRPLLSITYTLPNNPPSAKYYSGACDIYAGKKVTTIQTGHTDPDGADDVDDCRIMIGDKEKYYFTLQWNVDTDTYSIIDGSDYVSISGCTVRETSITNGYRLTWQFIVDWDFPYDDQDYDIYVWTDDESGADSGYIFDEAGTHTFENDLEVTVFKVKIDSDYDANHDGYITDDEWFAGGHKIIASGKVLYEGSDVPFDSAYASSVQVQLFYDTDGDGTPDDLGDTYSDSSISDGIFSITYTPGTTPALQPKASFDVAIQGIPSDGSDVTSTDIEITSKRDNEDPTSSLDVIIPYEQTSSEITITCSNADDAGSGIKSVTLWYRYSPDNSSWGSWIQKATDTTPWPTASWTFDFTQANGTGYYEFYSIASDNVSNIEDPPASKDTSCHYVPNTPPSISFNQPPTPANGSYTDTYANISVSVSDTTDNVSSFIDWDHSLRGYWSMDHMNNTGVYDNSTHSNFATFNGNDFGNSNQTAGIYGKGLELDGQDDYLEVNDDSSLDITNEITIEAWVKDPPLTPGLSYNGETSLNDTDKDSKKGNWIQKTNVVSNKNLNLTSKHSISEIYTLLEKAFMGLPLWRLLHVFCTSKDNQKLSSYSNITSKSLNQKPRIDSTFDKKEINQDDERQKSFDGNTSLRVIIKFKDTVNESVIKREISHFESAGFTKTAVSKQQRIVAGVLTRDLLMQIQNHPAVEAVYPDQSFKVLLTGPIKNIGVDKIRREYNLTGRGIKICILDTGVDPSVVNYSYGYDFINNDPVPEDKFKHGTMVASIIKEIAPDAELIVAKVVDDNGIGYESDVLEGLQWCIDQHPDIISFSIGSGGYDGFYDDDLVTQLCNHAVDEGIFVVAAVGENGRKFTAPACGSKIFSVGAADEQNHIASFSAVNPTLDMVAPGVNISTPVGVASGTSLAAPQVAAAAALLLEQQPSLTPQEIAYRLQSTGKPIHYQFNETFAFDIPLLDIYNALNNIKTMKPYNASDYHGEEKPLESGKWRPLYTTVTIQGAAYTQDSYVNHWSEDTNYGSQPYISLDSQINAENRIVIKFSLSAIPDDAYICSATLKLYYYDYTRDQAGEIVNCRRITSYNFYEDEVTWNKATSTQNWNSPGLYPDDVTSNTLDTTPIPSSFGWVSWNVTDAVRGWVNGTYNNYGLYLAFDNEDDLLSHETYFYSSDYTGDTSKTPKLEVTYCIPPTVTNDGGATNVEETTATLRGEVTDTGGETPTVTIYYGDNDGGTTPGNWDHSVDMGAQSSTFSKYVTGLTPGDLYYYRCYASNPAGDDWADSSEKFFTKPECPDSISVTGSTTTSISFSINKADMGPGATSYTYARYSTADYPTTRTSGTFAFNTTSTTVTKTGLNPGTKYYFSAWAWGEEGGVGQYSDAYITTYGYTKPGDPSNLNAYNPTATTINLSWTKGSGSGNEHTVIRYRTDTYPSSPTDGTEAYNGTGSATTVSGLTPGQIYYFRAWTYDPDSGYFSSGYSSDSEYTLPADITNFDAEASTSTSINISWTKGSGGDKTVIRRSTSGYPTSPTDGVEVYNGTGTWYNDTGLAPNTVYYYSAWAYDSDSGYFSENPAQDTETTLTGVPSVITNAATNVEETSATLNAYISNTGGENPYRYIEWGLYGQTFTHNESLGIGGVGPYHKDVTGLSKGTRYHFRGLANNSRGWGYGSILTFRTKPDPPTGFSATTINETTINLSWNKGDGAWHTVIIRKAGSMPNNRSDGIEIYNGTGTSYSDTGLNAFTTYYYRAWSITDTPDRQFSDPPDATASATTWSPKTILAKGDAYQLVINGTTLYGYINGVPLVSTTIDTNWHHVAFTYDGSTAKLYLDGELKDINTSYSQTIKTNDENLLIGKNFQGTLDEVRLWSRALTWEEINASYNAKATGSYYHNFTDLTYGNYTYYAYAIDTAGNENTTETRYYNCTSGGNQPPQRPIINSIDLRNGTGSKLDSDQMIDVNKEYYFLINVTDPDGWDDINYINITAWYDNGDENSYYNETPGGNLNLFLQYKNTTGTAEYKLLWPDDEVELIQANCSETIINSTTREIKISFRPKSQFRYAPGDGTWNATQNVTDDLYSWNVNVTVEDNSSARSWMKGEFGVYRYVNIEVPSNWIGVEALPGSYDDSNVVTITFSSNYNYVLSIWFSTNLVNQSTGSTIPIANNVYALASADPNDDITTDTPFSGIGESNAIEIINASGTFKPDGVSQTVNVQFRVYVPFGTLSGEYKANTRVKIEQKT